MSGASLPILLPKAFPYRTLPSLLRRQAMSSPARVALIASDSTGVERLVTYGELIAQAERFAAGLKILRAGQQEKIGILADNRVGYEASVTLLACILAGFIAVPINARYSREEVDHAATLTNLRFLIYDARLEETIGDIRDRVASLGILIRIGPGADGRVALSWDAVAAGPSVKGLFDVSVNESDISEILFTSGTTARPKAAMLTTSSGVYASLAYAGAVGLKAGDVYQSFIPFFTTAAIRCVLLPAWAVGATAVLDSVLDIEAILDRIARVRCTVYVGVPTFCILLLDAFDANRHDVSSLRIINAGGSPLQPETTQRLLAMFPRIDVRQTYGGTEGGPSGTTLIGKDALRKLGSAGRCWALTELRIVDDEDREVSTGELGEIVLRSPGIFAGYYQNDMASRETLRGGWMHSGDIGRVDEEGYLYVVDRKKDMVIRGGHNIGSFEVETVLQRHPRVSEVAVVGIPHSKLGEDLLAVVKTKTGEEVSGAELTEFCAGKLSDYKTPRHFVFVAEFPRSAMGKIMKRELRQTYLGYK